MSLFFLVTGYQRTKSNRLIFWEHVLRYQVVAVGIKCSYWMAKQTNISEMVSFKSSTLSSKSIVHSITLVWNHIYVPVTKKNKRNTCFLPEMCNALNTKIHLLLIWNKSLIIQFQKKKKILNNKFKQHDIIMLPLIFR